jgi:hypothetical protein
MPLELLPPPGFKGTTDLPLKTALASTTSAARSGTDDNNFDDGASRLDTRPNLWDIFGVDRDKVMSREATSDDEDMEATATMLEREEKRRWAISFAFLELSHRN